MHSLKFNFARIAFACLLLTVGFASTASAATSQFQILLNLDNNVSTGCDVPTLTGTFPGAEQILITTVNTTGSSAAVTAVELRGCVTPATDTFGPPSPVIPPPGRPLPWPVGVSNGTGGTSVIETFYPLSQAPAPGPSPIIRLGVLGFAGGGSLVDELINAQAGPGNGPPILMQIQGVSIAEVPTLSEWGLILLALLLAGMAVALMRRRTATAFLVALLLLCGAGLAWAATCDLDGTTIAEWIPSTLLATEPVSDAPAGADIRAFYGCRDAGLNGLCFRIDALLLFNQNPTADDQNVVTDEDTPVGITLTGSDPDGNPLTFTVLANPTNGVLSGTAPNLTYTPNADYNGPDSFTFQVDDGQGGTDTGTVTITVNGADDPPTAVNDVASVLEDAPATPIDVLANDTDPDAGPISIQSVTQPANGTVAITGGGTGLTYQPNPDYCNMPPGTTLDTFTYTLTPASATPTATVTVTVDCVNDPPVANNDAATVTEDDPATAINVLGNDTDAESDPFTIQSVTQPTNGTVVITGGGTGLTYQPNADYCNAPPGTTLDTFTYTLDPGGASATVSVTVTCVDDTPVAVADSATVAEDSGATAVPVLANDTDAENDSFTIQSVTQPANGTVVITGGGTGLTYQPNADYCNTPPGTTLDTFTYTLTPGGSSTTVTITVTCTDDDPVAVADAATVAEDSGATPVPVLANDTDVDGGPISITSVTQPTNGTVVITGGGTGLTYQPNADYCNTPPGTTLDTFTYTLTPGGSSTTVTMTVTCADDNPVAVPDAATVAEDSGATAVPVLANDTDVDGGPISITSVTQPANGVVVITGGGTGLTYQPNPDYCNSVSGTPDTFTYTLTPGGSSTTVTMTVTCADDDPTAINDSATVVEDSGANAIPVLANDTDPDGGAISITSVTQPANGTVVITGGGTGLTYQPNPNYCNSVSGTPDTFTYTLTPGGSTATVTVSVTCADDPPAAVNDSATVAEDSGASAIPVLANDTDVDGGPISITSVTQPANGTVVITGGGSGLTYQPNPDYCNSVSGTPDTFTYTLTPGGSTATVSVTVTCLDDAPVLDLDADDSEGTPGSDFAVTFTEGEAAKLIEDDTDATITDIDSATLASLTVTLTNLFDTGNEILSTDVTGTSITASYVTAPGTPGTGVLTLTGPDTVANFQTVLRKVRYLNTSNAPDTTPRVIEFVANDGTTNSNTATSTVTVVSTDTNPTAVADSTTVAEDSTNNAIDVLANDTDPDGGSISISSVTQPTNGSVTITGGGTGLTYTPNANYCNSVSGTPDTFTYTLTPGGSTATVSVTVTCADDNPVAVADAATVTEDAGATAIDVLANDTDPDGGPISITSVTQPANGTVVITGGGTGLTYAPNANYCNSVSGVPDTFTYTLAPGGSSTTVTVTVTCVDDDPVAVADAATVVEDSGANSINVLANDTDVDGGAISITSVTQPANGAVVITGGGTGLTYAPNPNYCNSVSGIPDTFTYTLTPGGSTATVSVTVTCVDDPPTAVADAAMVNEDSGANAIPVLANDTDPDGGPISITSVTQPANGTVVITGGGTGLTYAPNANYCNSVSGVPDTFTYTLTPGGSSTTVTMTVTCVNDPPVADNDTFDFIGNTELRVDLAAASTPHALETTPSTFGVLDGDSDPVENDAISVTGIVGCADIAAPFVCAIPGVGTVTMESNGRFSFVPEPGDAGATETFQYIVSDDGAPAPASTTATVTLTRFERVWYVKNDAPAGGNGTSTSPFNSITAANLSDNPGDGDLTDDLDSAGDYIFVYFGNGTAANQSGGLVLENNQHLIGEHAGLSLNVNLNGNGAPTNLVTAAPGSRPLLDDTVVDAFEGVSARDVIPAEIVGMNLAGNVNAIDWTTTAAFAGTGTLSIRDNVVRSAANEGVDINLAGTGATRLAFHDNTLTSTGTALDIQETGAGALTLTRFDDNVVNGNTGGSGIIVSNAIFDSVPGGAIQTVDGGTTVIGASGNGVGGAGMALGNVQGDLHFTGNLNIFADGGAGLTVSGTGVGMQFRVNSGGAPTGIIEATGGPAVDATAAALDLRLTSLRSTSSASTGVSLTNVTGTFSGESGSTITNATGTDFAISGGTAAVTYKGTITDDVGQLVSVSGATAGTKSFEGAITDGDDGDGNGVSLSGNTGATVRFSGGLTLSTGGNAAFAATGGGTVEVCDENPCNGAATGALINKLTTTTGTALNVANTTISSNNLEFRSISAGTAASGPANGIVLNTTGASGGLKVKGTGSAGSGGTIQRAGTGISLTSTRNVSLSRMQLNDFTDFAIRGASVVNFDMDNSVINGTNGNDAGADEGSVRFSELTGSASISSTSISGSVETNLRVVNTAGSLNRLMLSGTTIGTNSTATGDDGLFFEAQATAAVMNVTVQNSFFTASRGDLAQFNNSSSGTMDIVVSGTAFSDNHPAIVAGGGGVVLGAVSGTTTYNVNNNTFRDATGTALAVSCGNAGVSCVGRIEGNTIGLAGTPNSGSTNASGIAVVNSGGGTITSLVNSNTIRQYNNHGILLQAGQTGGNPTNFNVTVTNNTIGNPGTINTDFNGIHLNNGTLPGENFTSCVDIRTNSIAGSGTGPTVPNNADFRLRQRQSTTVRLPGYGGANNNDAAVVAFVSGNQTTVTTGAASNTVPTGGGFVGGASCPTPP